MCFVALRATAFAMLLHLSQVTPGLSCTFTRFNGANSTNVKIIYDHEFDYEAPAFESCLKKCYESADCNFFVLDQESFNCYVYAPGEGEVNRDLFTQPDFYQIHRNVSITSCPTVEQFMAQKTGYDDYTL